jgi:hypothetical protein
VGLQHGAVVAATAVLFLLGGTVLPLAALVHLQQHHAKPIGREPIAPIAAKQARHTWACRPRPSLNHVQVHLAWIWMTQNTFASKRSWSKEGSDALEAVHERPGELAVISSALRDVLL